VTFEVPRREKLRGSSLSSVYRWIRSDRQQLQSSKARMTSAPARSAPQVLVVDDDESIRQVLSDALQQEGFRVVTAIHGQEALERLRDVPVPALAIVDLMMPVMSGWDLIGVLRRMPEFASLPIVVISAMRPRDLPAGVMFLAKPFDLTEISQLLQKHSALSDEEPS
jgi:CheY-like chemotaxis protein